MVKLGKLVSKPLLFLDKKNRTIYAMRMARRNLDDGREYLDKVMSQKVWVAIGPYELYGLEKCVLLLARASTDERKRGQLKDLYYALSKLTRYIRKESLFTEKKLGTEKIQPVLVHFRERTRGIDFSEFDFPWWLLHRFANLFLMIDDFLGYYKLRELYHKAALRSDEMDVKFSAAIETGNRDVFDDELVRYANAHPYRSHYFRLMTGAPGALKDFQVRTKDNHLLYDLVNGKRVAIVGPAPSEHLQGQEIDSFDLVYRLSFGSSGIFEISRPEIYGGRVDISFYSGGIGRRMRENLTIAARKVKLISVKTRDSHQYFAKIAGTHLHLRNEYMLRTAPNGIQYILYDLLFCGPKEIKLFCMDFYSGKKQYNDDYLRNLLDPYKAFGAWDHTYAFLGHDLVANFLYVRKLHEKGYVKADLVAGPVLELSPRGYIETLAANYRNKKNVAGGQAEA